MVLSITRAAGSCGNFPQLHTPAAWLPHGVLTEKCGACHCGKGRAVKNHLWSSLGVPVNTNLGGGGAGAGILKCWEGPEKVKPREVCARLLIFHIGSEGPTGFSHSALGREESIVIRSGTWDPEKNCREFELLAALGWRRELWTSKVSKPKTNGQMASARIWKFSINDLNVCMP